ncbi:rhodanese domain-containing protein CG4456 [Hyalella azteca]|uniref:Rhodanese domain-containing protein CG4456 n=1 Tax=Hyalella azteca TaxID=294128 RepID=A0A8B7PN38_HYAAZ|nr:rhodanese domain-containing protein CG4456 [Hyalella azteca]
MASLRCLLLLLVVCSPWQDVLAVNVTEATPTCPEEPKGIEAEALLPGIDNKSLVVVDVRPAEDLANDGRIPGSFNVPLPELVAAFKLESAAFNAQYGFEKPAADKLVLSCRSGGPALEAWRSLSPLGYCHARVYFGSFLDWQAKGLPIERGLEGTTRNNSSG